MGQVLSIPVTDFELSVRSRNCLQKMGIMTLGDLCRCTEQELLASKNFGETSLVEIKEMLATKGLRLGQYAQERPAAEVFEPEILSADEQAMLARPIADLNLSVRARKCMIRLGINTLGDLVRRTGDDLLECKNFGVTSLNEVREKLTVLGLKLRGEIVRKGDCGDDTSFDRITFDPQIMGGRACIRGMRIPVSVIVGQVANHATVLNEILEGYPELEPADIDQALQYAAWLTSKRRFDQPFRSCPMRFLCDMGNLASS